MVAEGGSIGRPHIAKAITNAGGTSNVMEAYSKYIHRQSPVYVERKKRLHRLMLLKLFMMREVFLL